MNREATNCRKKQKTSKWKQQTAEESRNTKGDQQTEQGNSKLQKKAANFTG